MTRASESFDWDKAIALFKGSTLGMYDVPVSTETIEELRADAYQSAVHPTTPEPAQRCRKDLHDMTPENTYLNTRTGHRRCRACTKLAEQTRRKDEAERKRKQENAYGEEWPETVVSAIHIFESVSPAEPDVSAEQLTPDVAPVDETVAIHVTPDSVLHIPYPQPPIQIPAEALPPYEKSSVTVKPLSEESPEDDLAKYRESDSPDTRLLADIATSLRILVGRVNEPA